VNELVANSDDILEGIAIMEEKQLVQKFKEALLEGKANYGEQQVRDNLLMGAVEILLLSEGLKQKRVILTCENCDAVLEKTVKPEEVEDFISNNQRKQCTECKAVNWSYTIIDLILDLGNLAEKSSTRVEIISAKTEEGRQIQSFGGICVILRYNLI
jgi:peptide chain release factor subunit 1